MTYPVDYGESLNVVAANCSHDKWDGAWIYKDDFNKIAQEFEGWATHAQSIIKLLDNDATTAWSIWESPPTP